MDMAVGIPGGLRWFNSLLDGNQQSLNNGPSLPSRKKKNPNTPVRYQADAKASLVGRLIAASCCHVAAPTSPKNKYSTAQQHYHSEANSSTSNTQQCNTLGRTDREGLSFENVCGVELNVSHAGKSLCSAQTRQTFAAGIDVMPLKDSRVERLDEFRLMRRQYGR